MSFQDWLRPTVTIGTPSYRHQDIREEPGSRALGMATLQQRVKAAHADVRRHLEQLFAIPLDPRGHKDVLPGYPGKLPDRTLKGYLGEVMAGVVAEEFSP